MNRGPAGGRGPGRGGSPGSFQGREDVDQVFLALGQHRKTAGRGLGALAEPSNLRRSVFRQRPIAPELGLALFPPAIELLLDDDQLTALSLNPVPEPLHVGEQCPILAARQKKVLVPGQQVRERLGGQEHLKGVERSPLVDIDQPPLQHRPPISQVVLGQGQLPAGVVELTAQPADLPLQFVDEPIGRFALPLQVVELPAGIPDLALEPFLVLPEPITLGPDLLQPLPALLEIGGLLGRQRGAGQAAPDRDGSGDETPPAGAATHS